MKPLCRFFVLLIVPLLWAQTGRADITVMLENPLPDQRVSGISVVSGWAFSSVPGAQVTVRLFVNGSEFGEIPCCIERQDVVDVYGPQALQSGFGQAFNYNLLPDNSTIMIEVSDDVGSVPQRAEARVTVVKPGGFEFLSQLDLLFTDSIAIGDDQKEIEITGVIARQDAENAEQVTLRVAWQENLQNLGIVHSEITTPATEENRSAAAERESTRDQTEEEPPTIQMALENPPNLRTVSGIGVVSGWAFPTDPNAIITSVQQRLDETPVGEIPCCSERADVAQAFPDQPQALQSGFGAPMNFNVLTNGTHTIGVEARDSTGASRVVDNQVVVVKPGNYEFIDLFDLSNAEAFINGVNLEIDNVVVRDKKSQETQQIDVFFAWQESCQCFVAQASCGNGNIELGEECDGAALGGASCSSLGYSGGDLTCTLSCDFDISQCEGGPSAYVTNVKSDSVSVVNTATNTIQATIPVGGEPRGIAISPDATVAYVTNTRDNTVSVIDTATNTVTGEPISVGRSPQGLAFSPDGARAYVVNGRDGTVSVINTATRTIEGEPLPVGREPQAIALTPDGTRAYVSNFADNSVTVLNLSTNSPEATIPVGKGPNGIAVRPPDGSSVYVANFNDDTVSVINTATNEVTDTVEVSFLPVKVAFSPDGSQAFVSNSLDYTVSVIDTKTLEEVNAVFVGVDFFNDVLNEPDGVAVTPNGKRVYVAIYGRNGAGDTLRVFSSVTGHIVGSVKLGNAPFAVAITPSPQP